MPISKIYRNSPSRMFYLERSWENCTTVQTVCQQEYANSFVWLALKIAAGCGILCIVNDVWSIRWAQPKELEQWISRQYGVSAEYPWAVSPENAVFRHRENKKWFALLLRVTGDKLGCPGTAPVWILNVKCDSLMIGSLCSMEGIYPAYHMNKAHWISIAMDDRVPRVLVQDLLDQSYASTAFAPRRQKRR